MRIRITKNSILSAISLFAIFVLMIQTLPFNAFADNGKTKNVAVYTDASTSGDIVSYNQYIQKFDNANRPEKDIVISKENLSAENKGTTIKYDIDGVNAPAVLTEEESFATWNFEVSESGLYNLVIRYYPYEGKGGDINRILYIDGKIPFSEAKYITINRIWKEEYAGDNCCRFYRVYLNTVIYLSFCRKAYGFFGV